jgi:hypothetical protein
MLVEDSELDFPVDQIGAIWTNRGSFGLNSPSRPGRRWKILVEDRFIQLGSFLQWGDTKFLVQDGNATPVRFDCSWSVAGPSMKKHDKPVGRLVQRVEVDPTVNRRDRG